MKQPPRFVSGLLLVATLLMIPALHAQAPASAGPSKEQTPAPKIPASDATPKQTVVGAKPATRSGQGISGETNKPLLTLAASVAQLLETGDIAAFVQATNASEADW